MAGDKIQEGWDQQSTWRPFDFGSGTDSYACLTSTEEDCGSFAMPASGNAQIGNDCGDNDASSRSRVPGDEDARRAKRKAQNRAAQRAYRTKKEEQLHGLENQVADLEAKLQSSDVEKGRLRVALSEARRQIDILKSISPDRTTSPDQTELTVTSSGRPVDVLLDQEARTLTLNLDLGSLLRTATISNQRQSPISTPYSCYNSDSGIFSF